jgi:ChAPs (Chs5p-Arf1p-binding proteins)
MLFLELGPFSLELIGKVKLEFLSHSSCFNAFSRVDMRVEVKIPGGVKTHVIDERGNKYIMN